MSVKDKFQTLSEDDLRQKIIMPLLFVLGCQDVRDNCGPAEYGKDILYLCRDHFLREKVWGAVLIKKEDINKSSLDNIHRQISDAINQFIDPDDPRNKIQLHEILVITSRSIMNWTHFTRAGAQKVIDRFVALGILQAREAKGAYDRTYIYRKYVEIFIK